MAELLVPVDGAEPPTASEIRTALSRLANFDVSDNRPSEGATWHLEIKHRELADRDAYITVQHEKEPRNAGRT